MERVGLRLREHCKVDKGQKRLLRDDAYLCFQCCLCTRFTMSPLTKNYYRHALYYVMTYNSEVDLGYSQSSFLLFAEAGFNVAAFDTVVVTRGVEERSTFMVSFLLDYSRDKMTRYHPYRR